MKPLENVILNLSKAIHQARETNGGAVLAIPTSIHNLLSGREVEWARVEFKTTWDPEASLKTICAFANDLDNWGGGYIVIGVKEPVKNFV